MAWTDPTTRATGDLISASDWNNLLGATGSLMELKVHTHDGTAGDGDDELTGVDLVTFDEVAEPAAPGASKVRLFAKTGSGKLWARAGASGNSFVLGADEMFDQMLGKWGLY